MNTKIASAIIVTTLAFSFFTIEAAESHKSIPTIFQGKWTSSLKDCGTDHETNLEIFKNHISFFESDGPVISIVTKQKNELALIIELTGEGDEWLDFVHFKINNKNNQLTDITDAYNKNKLIWHRCK